MQSYKLAEWFQTHFHISFSGTMMVHKDPNMSEIHSSLPWIVEVGVVSSVTVIGSVAVGFGSLDSDVDEALHNNARPEGV